MSGPQIKALLVKNGIGDVPAGEFERLIMAQRSPKNGYVDWNDLKTVAPLAPNVFTYGY